MRIRPVLLSVFFGAVLFSPIAVGILPVLLSAPIAAIFLVFTVYTFRAEWSSRAGQFGLVLLAVCSALTLSELIARPVIFYRFDFRPADRFLYRWPPLPQLQRYVGRVNFEGETYGDLAAASGRRDWREKRQVRFVTDAHGFRNDPSGSGGQARPLDVIVLGDSFGVAAGTSQENTLSSVLARDYNLNVYNLSISRENPSQEYANLVLEGERLKTRKATLVLWLIFPGNDLDEPYFRELEHPQPAWPSFSRRLWNSFSDFRAHSALLRLLSRRRSQQVIERRFIDGRRILFHAAYAQRRNRTTEDITQHPNFESMKATLDAMRILAQARQLDVAVGVVPSKEEVYSWTLDGALPWSGDPRPSSFSIVLRGLCEQRGFRFLDLKPSLMEVSRQTYEKSGALLWWHDDSHWNGEGQRAAASAIYKNLLPGIQPP